MKTLLRDGPLDGKVIDTGRTDFGYAEVTDRFREVDGRREFVGRETVYYERAYGRDERHPCKARGTVRVFVFDPEGPPKMSRPLTARRPADAGE